MRLIFPILKLILFSLFVSGVLSACCFYYIVFLSLISWLANLLIKSFEQFVAHNLIALNKIIDVSNPSYLPIITTEFCMPRNLAVSITKEGLAGGYTNDDSYILAHDFYLYGTCKAFIKKFNNESALIPYFLFPVRLILWICISNIELTN